MESKQYITKWPMDHWRNEIKIPRDKWKQNHNDIKPMEQSKTDQRGKFIAIQFYPRKQENS